MTKTVRRRLKGSCSTLLCLLAVAGHSAIAQDQNSPVRFQVLTQPSSTVPPGVLRSTRSELDLSVLGGPGTTAVLRDTDPLHISLELADGSSVLIERSERRLLVRGGYSWLGHVLGKPAGQAIFIVRDAKVYGSVRRPGLNLQIRPEQSGFHRLDERDDSWWPEDVADWVPARRQVFLCIGDN